MANPTTSSNPPNQPTPPSPPAIFCQMVAGGYVVASQEEQEQWLRDVREGRSLTMSWESLVTIKLLAPEASSDLILSPLMSAQTIYVEVEQELLRRVIAAERSRR